MWLKGVLIAIACLADNRSTVHALNKFPTLHELNSFTDKQPILLATCLSLAPAAMTIDHLGSHKIAWVFTAGVVANHGINTAINLHW
jgi:hypothetical protein